MKPILGILTAIFFGALFVIYLFRGFGADETGALFRDQEIALPVSYFKTPETAVKRINDLVARQDWSQLAQFYDLDGSAVTKSQLLDGTFFLEDPEVATADLRDYLHPFPPGATYYEARQVADSDLFEVDAMWTMDLPWSDDQEHVTTFLLRRFPQGYRLVPERVTTQLMRPLGAPDEDGPND